LVEGTIYGGEDVGEIPSTLVQRVDVVTGGASAVWGSDAVAGVVNYVMNHDFNGVQINLEGSNNNQNAHPQYRMEFTAGTGFDDNRGHIEVSASDWRVPDVYFIHQTEGYAGQWLVNNPACSLAVGTPDPYTGLICPQGKAPLVHATNVGAYGMTPGGIIDGCLAADGATSVPCTMTNTYFVGPNATPMTFNPGNVTAGYLTNGGTLNTVLNYGGVKGSPFKNDTAFLHGSFKINDHLEATLQFNFGYTGRSENTSTPYLQQGDATIYSGNPFIPASIQSQMNAQGIGALAMGTTLTNPNTGPVPNLQALAAGVTSELVATSRRMLRGVFGLDGDLGSNWTWKAYYERSETHNVTNVFNMPYVQGLYNAEDAVRVGSYTAHYTAANYPNPLGFAPGTITCLSNLLPIGAPGESGPSSVGGICSPLNIFGSGPGVASPEAVQYIAGIARAGGDTEHTNIYQDVVSASAQGKLPVGTPAGPVALAAGLVYRREEGVSVNCGINCDNAIFDAGNFSSFAGVYSVREGSLELNAPLLKNQGVKDLNIDAAYRGIDYSTSGFVQTYKFGVVSQIVDAVRVRASYSKDIRAGNLQEEFQTPATEGGGIFNPRTGTIYTSGYSVSEGNKDIQPENAETRTAGFVFTPFQGLTSSLDWYDIRIKDVISTVGGRQVTGLCEAGYSVFCLDLVWGKYPGGCTGPSINSCPITDPLVAIINRVQNIDSADTAGLDFLTDYRMQFMAGALDFNADYNYVFHYDTTHLGTTCDTANGLGPDQGSYPGCGFGGGNPKFRGTLAVSYTQGGWLGTVQTRMIGATHLVTQWINMNEVDSNDIPFYTYVDLRLTYSFGNGIQLYGAIDNIGDRIDPVFAPSGYSGYDFYLSPLRDEIYDGYGRVWRLGLRARL
jgi:outer membrane receptor protein involved in Fe transport